MPRVTRFLALLLAAAVMTACSAAGATASPTATAVESTSAASGDTITVTGRDYAFDGLPDTVPVGTQLAFTNASTDEVHLLVVVRKNDDVSRTLEDLLKNGTEEEQQTMTTEAGELEAMPGGDADGTITLDEPGEYLALCPIPVGSMASPDETAVPHFMKGMYQSFTVE